jgi:predicted Zn-dependent protease
MRARMRLPDDGVNVSDRHPVMEAGWLIGGIGILMAVIFLVLAFFAEFAAPLITPESEAHWLAGLGAADSGDDDAVHLAQGRRLSGLLAKVGRGWPDDPYKHSIRVVGGALPNAFAVPGGMILVTEGLLDGAQSENEVAFILAHELGHFHHRDHLRGVTRRLLFQVLLAPVAGTAASSLAEAMAELGGQRHSRKQETAADAFGLGLVCRLYGHARGADGMFKRLLVTTGESKLASFGSSHPLSSRRIKAMAELAGALDCPVTGEVTPWAK